MSGHISIDVNPHGETNSRLQVSEQFAYNLAQTLKVKHDIGRARGRGLYGAERSEFAVIKTPKAMACRDGTCLNKKLESEKGDVGVLDRSNGPRVGCKPQVNYICVHQWQKDMTPASGPECSLLSSPFSCSYGSLGSQ